jgi:hypothetical protein
MVPRPEARGAMDHTPMDQLKHILDAIDVDVDLILAMGSRCEAQAARAGSGYDRIGIVTFTSGAEFRLVRAGKVLLRIGGQDLLCRVVAKIVEENHGDHRRRQILRRLWGLDGESNPARRAS